MEAVHRAAKWHVESLGCLKQSGDLSDYKWAESLPSSCHQLLLSDPYSVFNNIVLKAYCHLGLQLGHTQIGLWLDRHEVCAPDKPIPQWILQILADIHSQSRMQVVTVYARPCMTLHIHAYTICHQMMILVWNSDMKVGGRYVLLQGMVVFCESLGWQVFLCKNNNIVLNCQMEKVD